MDLARVKPAFKQDSSVTAGNSFGMNDGAAMLVVARKSVAERYGWTPLATIDAYASAGCDPGQLHNLLSLKGACGSAL